MTSASSVLAIEDDSRARGPVTLVLERAGYRLVRKIGQRGDQDVFLAVHRRNGREVVLEVDRARGAAAGDPVTA
ncbi:MAG TPA: hypothetical protein VFV84_14285 [Burkholderiales bacterium]|nr:hypothetical protein [Burkholderiales bacterium]